MKNIESGNKLLEIRKRSRQTLSKNTPQIERAGQLGLRKKKKMCNGSGG
jgi:hypothetical protein